MMKTYDFDELLAERSSAAQAAIESRYQEILRCFPLSALRTDCGRSQSYIAAALKISQAAVSKMEARNDVLLSTLHRYVKALDGEIRVAISVDDRSYEIAPSSPRGAGFVLQQEHRASPAVLFGASNVRAQHPSQKRPTQPHGLYKHSVLNSVNFGAQTSGYVANDHGCPDLLAA